MSAITAKDLCDDWAGTLLSHLGRWYEVMVCEYDGDVEGASVCLVAEAVRFRGDGYSEDCQIRLVMFLYPGDLLSVSRAVKA